MASKTIAAQWIVDKLTPKEALIVFIGDDDKDEEAFGIALKIRRDCYTHFSHSMSNSSTVVSEEPWLDTYLAK